MKGREKGGGENRGEGKKEEKKGCFTGESNPGHFM